MKLRDEVLPEFDFRERHAVRVDAPAERVFAAIRAVTLAEMPVVRLLMRLRGIAADADRPLLEDMQRSFRVLAEVPQRGLVLGSVGQPWRLRGGSRPVVADFESFAEPGYAKMALDFVFDRGVLSTETRVLLTDARARRRFRPYWLAIRPFSGLIRRMWLRAVKHRAEAAP